MPHLSAVAQLSCFCSLQMHRLITIIHIASAIRHCTSILSESQIPRVHHALLFICAAMCDFRRDKSGNWGGRRVASSACNAETQIEREGHRQPCPPIYSNTRDCKGCGGPLTQRCAPEERPAVCNG
jgi:hypothetical protein